MPLRLLSTEVSYVQSVLEETLEEVEESGTFLALRESVAKSRERNKEKNEIGLVINNNATFHSSEIIGLCLVK